jgi:hypothetical protein
MKPKSAVDYNKEMVGDDKVVQHIALYPVMCCYIIGYKKIF